MAVDHKVWLICDKCSKKEETPNAGSYNIAGWKHINISGWTDHIPYKSDNIDLRFVFCAKCCENENTNKLIADQLFRS